MASSRLLLLLPLFLPLSLVACGGGGSTPVPTGTSSSAAAPSSPSPTSIQPSSPASQVPPSAGETPSAASSGAPSPQELPASWTSSFSKREERRRACQEAARTGETWSLVNGSPTKDSIRRRASQQAGKSLEALAPYAPKREEAQALLRFGGAFRQGTPTALTEGELQAASSALSTTCGDLQASASPRR